MPSSRERACAADIPYFRDSRSRVGVTAMGAFGSSWKVWILSSMSAAWGDAAIASLRRFSPR
jgi:hypothetical protein